MFFWKRFFLIINSIFLSSPVLFSQANPPFLEKATSNNTLLWEVTGNGLKNPSYFLGTMHILCPDDAWLSASVHKILDTATAIYFEIDLDNMALMAGSLRAMPMLNDTTLADLLPAGDIRKVEDYFAGKIPLPFSMLQRFKPMLLSSLLAEQMLPCKAGSGTEMLLMEAAKKSKIPTEGLETPAYQFGLFDSIPYKIQAEELVKAISSESAAEDSVINRMLAAFQQQDLEALAILTQSEEAGLAGYSALLVDNRNRNWVEKFGTLAQKGPLLFAVGAAHLPGENGVLRLLERKGYHLRPIVNKKPD